MEPTASCDPHGVQEEPAESGPTATGKPVLPMDQIRRVGHHIKSGRMGNTVPEEGGRESEVWVTYQWVATCVVPQDGRWKCGKAVVQILSLGGLRSHAATGRISEKIK